MKENMISRAADMMHCCTDARRQLCRLPAKSPDRVRVHMPPPLMLWSYMGFCFLARLLALDSGSSGGDRLFLPPLSGHVMSYSADHNRAEQSRSRGEQ